jgi:hypothetical protein
MKINITPKFLVVERYKDEFLTENIHQFIQLISKQIIKTPSNILSSIREESFLLISLYHFLKNSIYKY